MKNIDKIREMNSEDLIIFMNSNKCDKCSYNGTNCMHDFCREGMKSWLEQEAELTIEDIRDEFNEFCTNNRCDECDYPNDGDCHYHYTVDHFNIINGKITRR